MLHKYLQGNSLTTVILTCALETNHLQSTLSTLKFGQHVSKLRNTVKMNKELSLDMLKSIVNELETRVRYYQRLENISEEKSKTKLEDDEAFLSLKTAFEEASEERDLLRAELDAWLDERKADYDSQLKREEHFLSQINILNTRLVAMVLRI
jgi:hypothetical protein